LNLESVLFIEDRLYCIYDKIKEESSVVEMCEDWWEVARNEIILFEIYKIFKEDNLKKALRKSFVI
jgi:hypothetical protein